MMLLLLALLLVQVGRDRKPFCFNCLYTTNFKAQGVLCFMSFHLADRAKVQFPSGLPT